MRAFGAFAALAIGWGLCAPAHAQALFPLQAISGGGGGGPTISIAPTTVASSGNFTVTVANGPGNPNDWVAINTAGAPSDNSYFSFPWAYLNGSTTPPATGLTSASFSLSAPASAGSYDVRFLNGTATTPPYPILAQTSLTVSGGGGGGGSGPCTGADSPYVPAGYKCVPGSSDEFNGTSIDTSKWIATGTDCGSTPGEYESGGNMVAQALPVCGGVQFGFNGSTSAGLRSVFPMPDAPAYIEFRRMLTPATVALMQFWKNSCGDTSSCTGEETDIDMGQFNGCNQNNQGPGASPYGLCSGRFQWDGGNNAGFLDGGTAGSVAVDQDQQWHVIGLQILPDPAPNGTLIYSVDGVAVKTLTDMADDRWIHASHYLSSPNQGGHPDWFALDLFCSNGNGCNYDQTILWDYLRTYTPSGLPNGY